MEPFDAAIAPCETYDPTACQKALLAVLEPLGGLSFIKPGMNVVIKANLVSMLKPPKQRPPPTRRCFAP